MNGKNPFLIKYFDSMNYSEMTFLSLFNSDTLMFMSKDFIKKNKGCNVDFFSGIHYIQSSPGAGKTSIFKAFSPGILKALITSKRSEEVKDLYSFMCDNNLIIENRVRLLTIALSCARNYDMLDEIFTNGRRKQVFFALLNCRIAISALRAICTMKNLEITKDLDKITFVNLPDEMLTIDRSLNNGKDLFDWACNEERKLCRYLDSLSDNKLEISFMHSTLLVIKLLEPENIIVNGKKCIFKSLLIFDDVHKLSFNQRIWLNDAICQLRPDVGVWFGQRLEALSNEEIISGDGMIDREYQEKIDIEWLWSNKVKSKFPTWLRKIADRRVKSASVDTLNSFESCLQNELDILEYEQHFISGINNCKNEITKQAGVGSNRYDLVLDYVNQIEDLLEKAKNIMALEIYARRKNNGQLEFDFGQQLTLNEFSKIYTDNMNVAEYYFCINNDIPYYYGLDRIIKLSSYNIEQFLSFCAGIFDMSITQSMNSRKKNVSFAISPKEQESYIRTTADKRWNDILKRFDLGQEVQNFIYNIVRIAESTRNTGRNSYSGGAITGIGIEKNICDKMLRNFNNEKMLEILRICISARYLEKRVISQNNKEWFVFYLNRWICVKYNLPLGYGGWKQININKFQMLNTINLNVNRYEGEQYEIYMGE